MELIDGLPPSVAHVAEYLARWAKGYNNHLKWNEKAKFKADLMNARRRWHGVSPEAFAAKLRKEGMRGEDIAELIDWLKKAQAGRRLVPQRSYRDDNFGPLDEPDYPPLVMSPDWT
jgi:hypothetical protein